MQRALQNVSLLKQDIFACDALQRFALKKCEILESSLEQDREVCKNIALLKYDIFVYGALQKLTLRNFKILEYYMSQK